MSVVLLTQLCMVAASPVQGIEGGNPLSLPHDVISANLFYQSLYHRKKIGNLVTPYFQRWLVGGYFFALFQV